MLLRNAVMSASTGVSVIMAVSALDGGQSVRLDSAFSSMTASEDSPAAMRMLVRAGAHLAALGVGSLVLSALEEEGAWGGRAQRPWSSTCTCCR